MSTLKAVIPYLPACTENFSLLFSLTDLSTRTSYEYAVDALSIQPNTSTAVTGLADVVPEVIYFTAVESVTVDQCSINLVERSASEPRSASDPPQSLRAESCEHENYFDEETCDNIASYEGWYDYCSVFHWSSNCAKSCFC